MTSTQCLAGDIYDGYFNAEINVTMELKLYASWSKTETKTKVLGAGLPRILLLYCPGLKTQLFRLVTQKIIVRYANLYDLRLSLLLKIWRSYKKKVIIELKLSEYSVLNNEFTYTFETRLTSTVLNFLFHWSSLIYT